MRDGEVQFICSVRESPHRDGVEIFFYRSAYPSGDGMLIKVKGNEREEVPFKRGASLESSLYLDREEVNALFAALSDKGFAPEKDAERKGELRATKAHLEDMRRLVFVPSAVEIQEETAHDKG